MLPGSIGGDLFGDPASFRVKFRDDLNEYLFMTMIKEYVKWHETNHRFHDEYHSDRKWLNYYYYTRFFWAFVGFSFAGMVINPNYTLPKSFYLRKINVFIFAFAGYAYGIRNYNNHYTLMQLRMNDYFPMEIKRALRTQDYRYLALFDYKNPGRQLFDEVTGKSLS